MTDISEQLRQDDILAYHFPISLKANSINRSPFLARNDPMCTAGLTGAVTMPESMRHLFGQWIDELREVNTKNCSFGYFGAMGRYDNSGCFEAMQNVMNDHYDIFSKTMEGGDFAPYDFEGYEDFY